MLIGLVFWGGVIFVYTLQLMWGVFVHIRLVYLRGGGIFCSDFLNSIGCIFVDWNSILGPGVWIS